MSTPAVSQDVVPYEDVAQIEAVTKLTCRHCNVAFTSRNKMMRHVYSDVCRRITPEAYATLQAEHATLQVRYDTLEKEHAALQSNTVTLSKNYAVLQSKYDVAQVNYIASQNKFKKENDALVTKNEQDRRTADRLRRERDAFFKANPGPFRLG